MGRAERRATPARNRARSPGWKTALRFDNDCPCAGRLHAKTGHCPRAATYWRNAGIAQPSFVVVNPTRASAATCWLLALRIQARLPVGRNSFLRRRRRLIRGMPSGLGESWAVDVSVVGIVVEPRFAGLEARDHTMSGRFKVFASMTAR